MSATPLPSGRNHNSSRRGSILVGVAVCAILCLALWLRWRYVTNISLYVDEFTTLWGATRIQLLGAPILPSGVLYTRGILNTYVTALFLSLGGLNYTVGRLPSVIFGLGAILAVFAVGRREWNLRVGLLAAVGLALLVEAIQWSGRARFYAQLMLFVLLMVWSAYAAIRQAPHGEEPGAATWRGHLLFAGLFVLALFSQEETLLLYPMTVLAIVWWRGWRYLFQRPVVVSQMIAGLAMVARYLIEVMGQPGYFETIQAERPYVGFVFDFVGAWRIYSPLLLDQERLPWTGGVIIAFAVAVVLLARTGWRPLALPAFHQATLYFGLQFVSVLLIILAIVGGTWRQTRYLLLVQPFWLLVGAAGLVVLLDRFVSRPIWRWLGTASMAAMLIILLWQPAQNLLAQQADGYDKVLAYVAANRQPGDVIMSPQPPACALVMGTPCDYYATQRGWEAYVIPRADGVLIDRWSGAPLLDNPADLEQVIRAAPRVWMVADGSRLGQRYRDDYMRTMVEQFDVAYAEQGAIALLAHGWRDLPAPAVMRTLEPPKVIGPLSLEGWARSEANSGAPLEITVYWRKRDSIDVQINTSFQVVAADGTRITQSDGPPGRGIFPTSAVGSVQMPDPKTLLLPTLAPGRYRIDVVAYDVVSLEPVADPLALDWFLVGDPPAPPAELVGAHWQDGIMLVGHDRLPAIVAPGETMNVRLVWVTSIPVNGNHTVFVQLLAADGSVVAQSDRAPENGFYLTWGWHPGELVEDSYSLTLPAALAPGALRLVVGLYEPIGGQRALLVDGSDMVTLAQPVVR